MRCAICGKEIYDKFNDNYIVSYCTDCNLEHCTLSVFKNLVLTKIKNKKCKSFIYSYLIKFINTEFKIPNWRIIQSQFDCSLYKYCAGSVNNCKIFKYNFYNFKFYFCFYQDLIIYNPNNLNQFVNLLIKLGKKYKLKVKLYNIFNWIKKLFIIEGIEKNVKK